MQQAEAVVDLDQPVDEYGAHARRNFRLVAFVSGSRHVIRPDGVIIFQLAQVGVNFLDVYGNELRIIRVKGVDVLYFLTGVKDKTLRLWLGVRVGVKSWGNVHSCESGSWKQKHRKRLLINWKYKRKQLK